MSNATAAAHVLARVKGNAGVIQARRCRQTGRVVSIYINAVQGLDDNDGTEPYSTVCEDHGGVVSHATLALARSWAAEPRTWCEDCQADSERR
jgi:hypothetical protein